jgi:hypothetical protein
MAPHRLLPAAYQDAAVQLHEGAETKQRPIVVHDDH